jgi:hypothetical protein
MDACTAAHAVERIRGRYCGRAGHRGIFSVKNPDVEMRSRIFLCQPRRSGLAIQRLVEGREELSCLPPSEITIQTHAGNIALSTDNAQNVLTSQPG